VQNGAFIMNEQPCRGSDMKLRRDATALLTLGPNMGRDKLMQAAARLRQLAKGQSLIIVAPTDICTSIEEACSLGADADIQPRNVLEWVLWNTSRATAKVCTLIQRLTSRKSKRKRNGKKFV